MDSLSQKMTADIEQNSEASVRLINDLKGEAQTILKAVDSISALFKQFGADKETCAMLSANLESVAPKICNLTTSIVDLDEKESSLVQRLEEITSALSDAQAQAKVALESQTWDQPANNELQVQLDEASAKFNMAQASLEAKERENEDVRRLLSEAMAQAHVAESRSTQLESEVAALKGNMEAIERNVREELNRASVISRDQIRAKFEQQLHKVLKDKADTEKDAQRIKEQLESAQQSVVGIVSFTALKILLITVDSNRGIVEARENGNRVNGKPMKYYCTLTTVNPCRYRKKRSRSRPFKSPELTSKFR